MDASLDPSEAPLAHRRPAPGDPHLAERRRLQARDAEALERFHGVYFDRVYAYVRRLVRDETVTEDLTQDIFLHIWRALPSYDPARDLEPWVYTIATHKVRDWWRSRRHADQPHTSSMEGEMARSSLARTHRGPAEVLQAKEISDAVAAAVEELPEIARATLVLRYYEGLSFAEIGRIIARSEVAVRKRYSRALEELRERLAGLWGSETS